MDWVIGLYNPYYNGHSECIKQKETSSQSKSIPAGS